MKFLGLILLLVLAVASYQIYQLFRERLNLTAEVNRLDRQIKPLEEDREKLKADIGYFQNDENLAKELRARFNYGKPGEKLIIVVPKEKKE